MTNDSVIEARRALARYEDRNSKPNPAHLADAIRLLLARIDEAGAVFEKARTPTDDAIRQAKREAWNEADLAHYPLVMAVEQFIDNGGDAWGNLDGPFEQVSALKNPYPKEPEATGGISGFPDITEALDKLTIRGEDHD